MATHDNQNSNGPSELETDINVVDTAWEVETNEFADLQDEVDEVDLDELLEDPEYIDFLESFGQLETADDEDMSVDDLVKMDVNDSESSEESSRASPERPRGSAPSKVVDGLISTLQSDDVTEDQRAALREALGLQTRKSTEVQLNYLKSRFLDLEAYLEAMEDFFDQNQTPLDDLEEQRIELENLRNEVETLNGQLEDVRRELETATDRQDEHGDELASLERSIEQTRDVLRRNLSVIETELEKSKRWRKRVSEATRCHDSDGQKDDPDGHQPDQD